MVTKKFFSKYNGEIELVRKKDQYELLVKGFVQSGQAGEYIWNESLGKLILPTEKINRVLILGFAAGSVVKLLRKRWPDCKITAVEIDPVMLEVAREFFPENLINVDVVTTNAVGFINSLPVKPTYDLIIVDCFLNGHEQLKDTQSIDFLLKLKQLAGYVLMNQLLFPYQDNPMKKVEFVRDLNKYFPVKAVRLPFNVMIGF